MLVSYNYILSVYDPFKLAVKNSASVSAGVSMPTRCLSCITLEIMTSFIFLKSMLISYLHFIPESSHHTNVQNLVMHCHDLSYVPATRLTMPRHLRIS